MKNKYILTILIIIVIIMSFVLIYTLTKKEPSTNNNVLTYNLETENFKFIMNGIENPEIKVKLGDRVKIILNNKEGFHDWVLDEFNVATKRISNGTVDSVEFIANKKGNFEYYCSVGEHRQRGMKGRFIIE